jgi:hypothetical protein
MYPINYEIQKLLQCINSGVFSADQELKMAQAIERLQVQEIKKQRKAS